MHGIFISSAGIHNNTMHNGSQHAANIVACDAAVAAESWGALVKKYCVKTHVTAAGARAALAAPLSYAVLASFQRAQYHCETVTFNSLYHSQSAQHNLPTDTYYKRRTPTKTPFKKTARFGSARTARLGPAEAWGVWVFPRRCGDGAAGRARLAGGQPGQPRDPQLRSGR